MRRNVLPALLAFAVLASAPARGDERSEAMRREREHQRRRRRDAAKRIAPSPMHSLARELDRRQRRKHLALFVLQDRLRRAEAERGPKHADVAAALRELG